MFSVFCAILLGATTPPPIVTITMLDGTTARGRMVAVEGETLQWVVEDQPETRALPLANVLFIDFPHPEKPAEKTSANPLAPRLFTTDGCLLPITNYHTDGREAHVKLVPLTSQTEAVELTIPLQHIRAVLFQAKTTQEWSQWLQTANVPRSHDSLVILRSGKQFALDGTVGKVSNEAVGFVVEGEELPVKRSRALGIFYANKLVTTDAAPLLHDRAGGVWTLDKWNWRENRLFIQTPTGTKRPLPPEAVARIDFSRGRITYLSDLQPLLAQHTPFFDRVWEFRRDVNALGKPLRTGGKSFAKGLLVHSRTVLEYDLGGRYQKLETILGLEDGTSALGHVFVQITGDGKLLWENHLTAGQPPQPLSLNVEDVRKLTLSVDFGDGFDLGDHVVFGDARVTK